MLNVGSTVPETLVLGWTEKVRVQRRSQLWASWLKGPSFLVLLLLCFPPVTDHTLHCGAI